MTFRHLVSLFAALAPVLTTGQSGSVTQVGQPPARANHQVMSGALPTQLPAAPLKIFGTAVSYDTGSAGAGPIAAADLNKDGKLDVVLGNCCAGSTVGVMLGNGDGTLQAPTGYAVGSTEAKSIAIADVNSDGNADLIVATYYEDGNLNSGGVAVLLGKGDGTFLPPVSYSSGGFYAIAVAITDVNGDGHPDLIVANQCQSSTSCGAYPPGSVGVLLGRGDGTFQASVSYASVVNTQWMAVADVNGDGTPDVVVAGGLEVVGVFIGNRDGTLQRFVQYATSGFPDSLAVGDLNGDGKPDVVLGVACPSGCPSAAVDVLLGNGDGTFQPQILSNLPLEDNFFIAIKDLDGDGKLDVVLGTSLVQKAYVLMGNGDGTFQAAVNYYLGLKPASAVAIADLNGDGKPDLLVTGKCSTCTNSNLSLKMFPNILDAATLGTLTSSANPSHVAQPVTFTATFTSNPPIPDAEVITFAVGSNVLGSGTTNNGVATFTTSFSKATTNVVKAEYPGDLFHKATTLSIPQKVTLYSTTTALSTSPNPSSFGQAVLLTAVVTTTGSATPTGKVTFKNGTLSLNSVVLDSTGKATLTTKFLPLGSDSITAFYGGDSLNANSTSPVVIQTVNSAP